MTGGADPTRYALLVAPSSNRVYADEAPRLTCAELAVFSETALGGARLRDLTPLTLGGVAYVGFTASPALTADEVAHLSNVSGGYALFVREGAHEATAGDAADEATAGDAAGDRSEELLRPVALSPLAYYDDDLLTILKYSGKTNEQFTQLLLNLTVLASDWAREMRQRQFVVLDPLCGRGTTLNQALQYGYDAFGIETDGGHVDAYGAFLRTYLRRKRLKHTVDAHPVRHERKRVARRLNATLAPTKEDYRAGRTQRVSVLHADTVQARPLLKPGSCDVIVTDTPYGVAHGARAPERSVRARRPAELLGAALPSWAELLRHGGALGMAYNTHVTSRAQLAALLADVGLEVVADPVFHGFAHWVDQAITRDVVVARKP